MDLKPSLEICTLPKVYYGDYKEDGLKVLSETERANYFRPNKTVSERGGEGAGEDMRPCGN